MDRPLEGLTVVEGSAFVAAPSGGMALAQLGAEVIRFDRIGGGIDHKRWPLTPDGASLYWNGLNKGKRSLAVDLTGREGQELVTELIGWAGNFITNFPASGWLSYQSLSARRSDLIMIAITGSYDGTTALDYTVNCAVGYPEATGYFDDPRPINHVLPAWDLLCGQMAALGLVAADRRRMNDGVGDLVTLALSDVALATVGTLGNLAEAQVLGSQREAIGNDLYGAYGRDFVTSDGRHVMIAAISGKQWLSLQQATGTTEQVHQLAAELGVDFADEGARYAARHRLSDIFLPWFMDRTISEVAEILDAEGVCWGPYQTFLQLVTEDDRCSTQNPLFSYLDQPGVGQHLVPGSPLSFASSPDRGAATAPRLGEHTEQVLAESLGFTSAEIGMMVDSGVVATAG